MSLYNPSDVTITDQDAQGLDVVIEETRVVLQNNLPWLDRAFGRAWRLPKKINEDGDIRREPHAYQGNGEYFNCMPNDNLPSFSFFIGKGPAIGQDVVPGGLQLSPFYQKRVDLIFYMRLDLLFPDKEYVYTEELINDIVIALGKAPQVTVNQIFHETIQEVYVDFNLEECIPDQLYWPFQGVRVQTTMNYKYSC